jgi:hypothetical protein
MARYYELSDRLYITFSGELQWPVRYVIQADVLVGMLALIVDVCRLSAEIFADLGRSLNRFRTSAKSTGPNLEFLDQFLEREQIYEVLIHVDLESVDGSMTSSQT